MTSEIRANTLKNRVGLGTVSFTDSGPIVSGIVTANTFSGTLSGGLPITNGANNRVITASSASAIQGETNLTFDGNTLFATGNITAANDGNKDTQTNIALTVRHSTNSAMRGNHFIHDDFPSGSGTYFIQATESGVTNDRNMCIQGYGGKIKIGGITEPTETLDVSGNVKATSINLANTIFHTGDTDTLMSFSTNTIKFETAGSERLRITSDGKIGINEQSPQSLLDIHDSAAANDTPEIRIESFRPTIRFADRSSSQADSEICGDNGIQFRISEESDNDTALTERVRITSDGKIGIATNTGSGLINTRHAGTNQQVLHVRADLGSSNGRSINLYTPDTDNTTAPFRFQTGNGYLFQCDSEDVFTIAHDRKVGIGTDNPGGLLTVYGSPAELRLQHTGNGSYSRLISDSSNELNIYTGGGPHLAMTIDGSQKVGIGEGNPSSILHVSGASSPTILNKPTDASPALFVGDSNRTGAGQHLAEYRGYWNGNLVGRIVFAAGDDTSNKDDGVITMHTSSGGSSSERLRITSDGKIEVKGTRSGSLQANDDDTLKLYTKSTNASINRGAGITFYTHDGSGYEMGGTIQVAKETAGANNPASYMRFSTQSGSTTTERLRIQSNGHIQIGTAADAGNALRYVDIGNYNTGSSAGSIMRLLTVKSDGSSSTSADIVKYKAGGLVINNNEAIGTAGYISFGTATGGGSTTERLRITSGGTLTSTISSPDPYNTVNTNLHLVNGAGNQGAGSRIDFSVGNGKAHIQSQVIGGNSNSGAALVFATSPDANGADERVRIGTTGVVHVNSVAGGQGVVAFGDPSGDSFQAQNRIGGDTIYVADETISDAIYMPRKGCFVIITPFSDTAGNYPQPNTACIAYIDCGPSRNIRICDLGTGVGQSVVAKNSYTSTVTDCDNNKLTIMAGNTEGTFRLVNREATSNYYYQITFL